MVSFILDALLIIICIVLITVSYKQGFVKTILSLCSSVAAVFVSMAFTPTVSSFIYERFMLSAVTGGIHDTVRSLVPEGTNEGVSQLLQTMPDAFKDILNRYNVSEDAISEMVSSAANGSMDVQSLSEGIASPIATALSNVIGFAVLFVATIIVLKIVIAIIDFIFKLPVLNSLNKVAGIVLGIVFAVVIVFVYSEASVQLVTSLGAIAPEFFGEKAIDDTIIVKFFSEYNVFGFIGNILHGEFVLPEK